MAQRSLSRRIRDAAQAFTGKRRFDAATGGRRAHGFQSFGSADSEARASAPILRTRARHAVNNNAWATSGRNAWTTAAIGPGIESKSAHPDAAQRAIIGAKFKEWTKRADADGLTDYFGVQAAVMDALVTDGESFVHIIQTTRGPQLRVLPAEMCDESRTGVRSDGFTDIGGVRFNAANERVGFWMFEENPAAALHGHIQSRLVPAADILHVVRPIGAGAVRGCSWYAPVLLTLSELDQWSDAQLVSAKVQAMLMAFLVDQNGTGQPFEGEDLANVSLEPGTIRRLPAGFDVKFSTPQQMQSAMEFGNFMLHAVAAGLGIPHWRLSGRMDGVNYSSARTAEISFRQRVEQLQFQTLAPQLLRPVFERVITSLVLSGELEAPNFESNAADFLAADFYPPAVMWIDPKKDAEAQALLVEKGFASRRQVVAALGFDIEQVDAERAADAAREKTLGLEAPAPAAGDETKKDKPDEE